MEDITINWNRCVYVDGPLDDNLLRRLTPEILRLRQAGNAPITVAIDSPGGSLTVLETLNGLLRGPDQSGESCTTITVVTNRAYSAAAMLLASGDYAVGLEHADVLFHDVRYGGLDDVTPASALDAAKKLQSSNESASLSLANQMFGRWMWNYLDLNKRFEAEKAKYAEQAQAFQEAFDACNLPATAIHLDLLGLTVSMFARLGRDNEILLVNALDHLKRWGSMTTLEVSTPRYSKPGDPAPGTLDAALKIYQQLRPQDTAAFGRQSNENDINLLLVLILGRISIRPRLSARVNFERALSDFALIKSIDDSRHLEIAARLMSRHRAVFFDSTVAHAWPNLDSDARNGIMETAGPAVRVVWLLCVLVARELFNGEHILSPEEAMVLGILDEIPGSDSIQSRRQFLQEVEREGQQVDTGERVLVHRRVKVPGRYKVAKSHSE